MKKQYHIFVADDSKNGAMRRFCFSSLHLRLAAGFFVFLLLALGVFAFDYTMAVSRQAELERLRRENQELDRHIHSVKNKVSGLESSLARIEDFSFKLKSITNYTEGKGITAPPAIGPLPSGYSEQYVGGFQEMREQRQAEQAPGQFENKEDEGLEEKKNFLNTTQSFENYLDSLEQRSHTAQKDIWFIIGVLDENKHLMNVTPSIQPARGWITSRFGYRDYPASLVGEGFSSKHGADFHRGLDIAAPTGTAVVSPADGVVSKAGYDAGTGNYIILDHGYNLKTLYGHLGSVEVLPSQTVRRGEMIGKIGNTGRSTGPHLHYEVRIAGQPVDPEYYILDFL